MARFSSPSVAGKLRKKTVEGKEFRSFGMGTQVAVPLASKVNSAESNLFSSLNSCNSSNS